MIKAPHHQPDSSIVAMAAVDLMMAIRSRSVSCVEVFDAYWAHIAQLNPQFNALVSLQDVDQLRAAADQRDHDLAVGHYWGSLHGMPQAPKDLLPVNGMLTSKGSPLFKTSQTSQDALAFERMRRAGAVFIGRSNTPEFGLGGHTYNPVYGTTRNALDVNLSAGGSSGGAACAVALHMLPVADGSDMMGSLRTPAAFNNVFGLRPSVGCVPHGPGDEVFLQQFSVTGPMARNVPDLALLLSVQAGYERQLPLSQSAHATPDYSALLDIDAKGLRIGWLGDMGGYLPFEPGVLELCEQALSHFDTLGCQLQAIDVHDFPLDHLWTAWLNLRSFQVAGNLTALYNHPAKRTQLKPEAIWEIERGRSLTAMDVYDASVVRSAWYQKLMRLFEDHEFLVLPGAQVFAFDASIDWPKSVGGRNMDTYHQWMEVVVPGTMASLPTLCVPAGFGPKGQAMGLQIMARPHQEVSLLQIGHQFDRVCGASRQTTALPQ